MAKTIDLGKVTGPQGPKGDTGATGAQGAQGAAGTSASCNVARTESDSYGNRTTTVTCKTGSSTTTATLKFPDVLVVDALPASPVAGTLYFVKEA